MKRRAFIGAGGALLLSGCAAGTARSGFDIADSTAVPAPQWREGDAWTFRRTDGYNGVPRGVLTRTVESADGSGFRVVTRNEAGAVLDDALFAAPGIELSGTLSEDGPVKGRFSAPLRIFDFPLSAGKAWRQSLSRTDANGYSTAISLDVRVEGWQDVRAADKTWRALVLHRSFMLGPKDAFSGALQREEREWYVPALRSPARIEIAEHIMNRSILRAASPGDRFIYVLERFRAA